MAGGLIPFSDLVIESPSLSIQMPVIAMNGENATYPVKTPTRSSKGTEVQEDATIINHPVYWLDDGSLVLDVEVQRFKIHRTLLSRHSRFFASLSSVPHKISGNGLASSSSPAAAQTQEFGHIVLDQRKEVKAEDVEALLQHLYHDL